MQVGIERILWQESPYLESPSKRVGECYRFSVVADITKSRKNRDTSYSSYAFNDAARTCGSKSWTTRTWMHAVCGRLSLQPTAKHATSVLKVFFSQYEHSQFNRLYLNYNFFPLFFKWPRLSSYLSSIIPRLRGNVDLICTVIHTDYHNK